MGHSVLRSGEAQMPDVHVQGGVENALLRHLTAEDEMADPRWWSRYESGVS